MVSARMGYSVEMMDCLVHDVWSFVFQWPMVSPLVLVRVYKWNQSDFYHWGYHTTSFVPESCQEV